MKRVILGVVILLYVLFVLLIGGFLKFPEIDTLYTPNFSYEKFQEIKKGMTKEQVKQILGDPFSIVKPGDERWGYSKNGKSGIADLNDFIGWRSIDVFFDEDQKVSSKSDHIFY